jgi:L-asparagine transporter-like permease
LFLWYLYPGLARQLFNVCMLGSCCVYVALFRSYIVCKKRYSNLPRQFNNILGTCSAVYGMIVFSFMTVALAFFQEDRYISLTVFITFIIIFLLYYFLVVQKREFFSDEEQAKFMKAYILNGKSSVLFISAFIFRSFLFAFLSCYPSFFLSFSRFSF